jgi:hypothetical protein
MIIRRLVSLFGSVLAVGVLFALSAPTNGHAQPSNDELTSLLPDTLDGRPQSSNGTLDGRPAVIGFYRGDAEGAYLFRLLIGYGSDLQQKFRDTSLKTAASTSTITSDGHTVHVLKDSAKVGGAAFPGKMVVVGTLLPPREGSWDADAAREQLMPLLRALELKGLAAFEPASPAPSVAGWQGPYRYPVNRDGQWGYIDTTGTMVIEPQFDHAARFSDSLARVQNGSTTAFINAGGQVVLEPEVDSVGHFSNGLAPARRTEDGPFGYVNKSGAFTIEPQFERAYAFSDGRAAVYTGAPQAAEAKFGYIDTTGTFVIEPQFRGARAYSGGRAPVLVGRFTSGKWGFIDERGQMVIDPQFDEALPFSEGRAAVSTGDKWGYIDEQGQYVLEPQYNRARSFSGGTAAVEDPFDGDVYIDRTGRSVSEEYVYAEPFRGPLARVFDCSGPLAIESSHQGGPVRFTVEGADGNWIYIDRQGRQVWP